MIQLQPTKTGVLQPFQFITASSVNQESLEQEPEDLFLQWPLQWPANRWKVDPQNKTTILFQGLKTQTIGEAYLESHWLNRSIQSIGGDKVRNHPVVIQ